MLTRLISIVSKHIKVEVVVVVIVVVFSKKLGPIWGMYKKIFPLDSLGSILGLILGSLLNSILGSILGAILCSIFG